MRLSDEPLERGFSEAKAAKYLGVSRSTLRQGRLRGVRPNAMPAPPFVRLGRRVVYLRDDLDRWLDAHRCQPNASEAR